MIEVLVTALVLSFGLLGIAVFHIKAGLGEQESYQRAQAIGLLTDMMERMRANSALASNYVISSTLGTNDGQPSSCTALAIGVARDQCEWSNALKGTAEQIAGVNSGGLTGGRGCITQLQAANPATGVCLPGIYQISVAWQGTHATIPPQIACGQGSYGGDDSMRRAILSQVIISLPTCQ